MTEIGLFPLGAVLLPTERLPLHIFEPRYKELIRECLAEEREFGLVLADEAGLREIGTRAAVTQVLQEFPDGRLNILVEGREPFRLLALTRGRLFQTGEVEPLDEERDPPADADVGRALELFRRLAEQAGAEVDEPEADSPWLSFELAAQVDFSVEVKQELLELRSERRRLKRLADLLEQAAEAIARQREIAERAARNGKVDRNLEI